MATNISNKQLSTLTPKILSLIPTPTASVETIDTTTKKKIKTKIIRIQCPATAVADASIISRTESSVELKLTEGKVETMEEQKTITLNGTDEKINPFGEKTEIKEFAATTETMKAAGDFSDYLELRKFVFGTGRNEIQSRLEMPYPSGYNYEQICELVCEELKDSYASCKKQDVIECFVAIYIKLKGVKSSNSTTEGEKDDFSNIGELTTYLYSKEFQNAVKAKQPNIDFNSAEANSALGKLIGEYAADSSKLKGLKKEELADKFISMVKPAEQQKGQEIISNLTRSAFIANSYGTERDKKDFITNSLQTLNNRIDMLLKNPELADVYTTNIFDNFVNTENGSNAEKSLVSSLLNSTKNIKVNQSCAKEFLDYKGRPHIDDDEQDRKYQEAMDNMLARLKAQNPNIKPNVLEEWFRTAQQNVFKNMSKKNQTVSMGNLVLETLRQFEQQVFANMSAYQYQTIEQSTSTNNNTTVSTPNNKDYTDVVNAMDVCLADIDSLLDEHDLNYYKNEYGSKINTEFGINGSGKIIFGNKTTESLYNDFCEQIVNDLTKYNKAEITKLGNGDREKGKEILAQIIQAAWISTYNTEASSTKHDTKDFLKKVGQNIKNLMTAIKKDPKLLDTIQQGTTYGNSDLVYGLNNYTSETISYADTVKNGKVTRYHDGSIHLSNTKDDVKYQQLMNDLLNRIIPLYPNIDPATIISLFRNAQENALVTAATDKSDMPLGTSKGNKKKISMNQLVQLTLYNFDKLLYAWMMKK